MADINSFTISGRLTRDAEQKMLPTGTMLITFDIANNTGWGEHEKVLFITVNLWGSSNTKILPYLVKGKNVAVTGRLELQKWVSKHDGTQQQKNVISTNEVLLMSDTNKGVSATVVNEEEDAVF